MITIGQLAAVGIEAPIGATSFSTMNSEISFCIGSRGIFVTRPLDTAQSAGLKEMGALGTFGKQIA